MWSPGAKRIILGYVDTVRMIPFGVYLFKCILVEDRQQMSHPLMRAWHLTILDILKGHFNLGI